MFRYGWLDHDNAQDFIDRESPWLTVNLIVSHWQISKRLLLGSIDSGLTPALYIDGHWYISQRVIEAGQGLGFIPVKRAQKSSVHKDQTSFLNLIDVASEV